MKVKYKLDTFLDKDINVTEAAAHDEIEQTFRAVLYLSERNQALKTISTPTFLISPYKIPWSFPRQYSDYVFIQKGKVLNLFDHTFVFHVSKRDDVESISKNASSTGQGVSGVLGGENKKLTASHKETVVIVPYINAIPADEHIGSSKLRRSGRLPVSTNDEHINSRMSGHAAVSTDDGHICCTKLQSGHVSTDDEHRGSRHLQRESPRYASETKQSSLPGSDHELGRSPTKIRNLEKRKKSVIDSEEETNSGTV